MFLPPPSLCDLQSPRRASPRCSAWSDSGKETVGFIGSGAAGAGRAGGADEIRRVDGRRQLPIAARAAAAASCSPRITGRWVVHDTLQQYRGPAYVRGCTGMYRGAGWPSYLVRVTRSGENIRFIRRSSEHWYVLPWNYGISIEKPI